MSLFRQLIKCSSEKHLSLLGFKEASLNAPSEVSLWTLFCEIEMLKCVINLISIIENSKEKRLIDELILPQELLKLEMHISLPRRVHNRSKISHHQLDLVEDSEFKFVEGSEMTITDLILFCHFSLLFTWLESNSLTDILPRTMEWYFRLKEILLPTFLMLISKNKNRTTNNISNFILPNQVFEQTFYKIENRKHKSANAEYTKQENVDVALSKAFSLGIEFSSKNPIGNTLEFDWSTLPTDVHPNNGNLPKDRMLRKRQQLESMAAEVIKIAKKGDVIVDFCTGTGHLGILLACALPDCHIILLDNKEESLVIRAKDWVNKLQLKNVSYFLGNINYFNGDFDIGVSLHSCGTATDIVLNKCFKKQASFVCCPCCYGKILVTQSITYPQSNTMKNADISLKDFLHLTHCADQEHDTKWEKCNVELAKQGELCTDIIDTDRKLKAEELGYRVVLKRLHPESCTPKNRLLIGEFNKAYRQIDF